MKIIIAALHAEVMWKSNPSWPYLILFEASVLYWKINNWTKKNRNNSNLPEKKKNGISPRKLCNTLTRPCNVFIHRIWSSDMIAKSSKYQNRNCHNTPVHMPTITIHRKKWHVWAFVNNTPTFLKMFTDTDFCLYWKKKKYYFKEHTQTKPMSR